MSKIWWISWMYKWKKCIKKGISTRFLALKIWALVVLKFFDVVLKFEPPNARFLYFPKNSVQVLTRWVLMIGYFVHWAALRWLSENQNKLSPNGCHYLLITYLTKITWYLGKNKFLLAVDKFINSKICFNHQNV